jgi:hypothetical protein
LQLADDIPAVVPVAPVMRIIVPLQNRPSLRIEKRLVRSGVLSLASGL